MLDSKQLTERPFGSLVAMLMVGSPKRVAGNYDLDDLDAEQSDVAASGRGIWAVCLFGRGPWANLAPWD